MPAPGTFSVTTPIYYVNDKPHLGHAYTTVAADVATRWHRMRGRDVWFQTGVDEHGQKVLEAATRRGLAPQAHVDELQQRFRDLFDRLEVRPDHFHRTTDPAHQAVVRAILQRLHDQGDLYQDTYAGWYSRSQERYFTEKDLVDGKDPIEGKPVEWIEERNWFFRMSRYAPSLVEWLDSHPRYVLPENRANEVRGVLRKEVGDLCITRPKSRMSWGIEVPFDPDYVTYVWFDALINYISAVGYGTDDERFRRLWPASAHLVGKDILTTHTLYWATMLFSLGLEPPDTVFAHGWWTVEGQKMSKSTGNVVDPHLLLDAYGPDIVRYFLLREIAFGADGDFSHQGLLTRVNAELANDLGNLAHRALSMTRSWLGGTVPAPGPRGPYEEALWAKAASAVSEYDAAMETWRFKDALQALVDLVGQGNKYIDLSAPWSLNKQGARDKLSEVLRTALEVCRVAGVLLTPFCPGKGPELLARLGCTVPRLDDAGLSAVARLEGLVEGSAVEVGDPLFPRLLKLPDAIEATLAAAGLAVEGKPEAAPPPPPTQVTLADFQRVQLRAARVVAARPHPDAGRLLILEVDLGEGRSRTVVAGIAEKYGPQDLVGRTVVVVANLAPASLRGIASEGMILAAGQGAKGEVHEVLFLGDGVPVGSWIR